MKPHTRVLAAVLLLWVPSVANAGCTQLFSVLNISGVQHHYHLAVNDSPQALSGTVVLNLQFRSNNEIVHRVAGVSLRYTVDDVPFGPVLTDNFASTLDTTTLSDGAHVLSVLFVNEPNSTSFCFYGREYPFAVVNVGVLTGPQIVPVIGASPNGTQILPALADYVAYPGYQPHAASHPYNYKFIPPANGVIPADFYSEPLTAPLSEFSEGAPGFFQLKNGSIVADTFSASLLFCDDLLERGWIFYQTAHTWTARKNHFDGLQGDAGVSPYTTFVPYLDGPGFVGISLDGRLFKLNLNGSVQTLTGYTGNRSITPFHYLDSTIPLSTVRATQTMVGNVDVFFKFPLDLAIDPNNHNLIYVADSQNHRIAMVDLTQNPPEVSTFAGAAGIAGYRDGSASSALFNNPSSVVMAPDGTMYISDTFNNVVRTISNGVVSTLAGIGHPGSSTPEPSTTLVAQAPLTYAPRTAVPFASAYVNYPEELRFDSKGNLLLNETATRTLRYIDLKAQTIATIAQFANRGSYSGEYEWFDVDTHCNVGRCDDIIATDSMNNAVYRIPITGTTQVPPPTLTTTSTYQLHNGHTKFISLPYTSTPRGVAIAAQEGRLIITGNASSQGIASLHILQATDPAFQLNNTVFAAGRQVWLTGTVPNFPFGSRPAFAAVHGYEGHSHLGNVLNFDDMVQMTDAQLAAYLQAGADGSVVRPELTGNDLRNVIYFIRRSATGGDLVTPGPNSGDLIAPVISEMSATQSSSTGMTLSWATDKGTIGVVAWGTAPGMYFGFSPIEAGYGSVHSAAISNLPAGATIYYSVRAKDVAGNQGAVVGSFTLQ